MEKLKFNAENFPQGYAFKQGLRKVEVPLQNIITAIVDTLGVGRGYVHTNRLEPEGTMVTGMGLCVLTTNITEATLRTKFPDAIISTITGEVKAFGTLPGRASADFYLDHLWNKIEFPNEPPLIMDMVYGQVNPSLNRVILDLDANRRYYYPSIKGARETSLRPIDVIVMDQITVSELASDKSLSKTEMIDVRRLAYGIQEVLEY